MNEDAIDVPKNNTDLSFILRKRLERINSKMDDFTLIINNFSLAVDQELENFVKNMSELQNNLNRIHLYKQGSIKGKNVAQEQETDQKKAQIARVSQPHGAENGGRQSKVSSNAKKDTIETVGMVKGNPGGN